jgi:uncharacterized protein YcgL (UPF0745 family)
MQAVKCVVYRSEKKAETYLYLAAGMKLEDLPEELTSVFGEAAPVMMLQLTPERKLSRVDVNRVLEALSSEGYFLQLPPELPTEKEIDRWIN